MELIHFAAMEREVTYLLKRYATNYFAACMKARKERWISPPSRIFDKPIPSIFEERIPSFVASLGREKVQTIINEARYWFIQNSDNPEDAEMLAFNLDWIPKVEDTDYEDASAVFIIAADCIHEIAINPEWE